LDGRPWRIVVGPVISANAYYYTSLPLDPDTARRAAVANDWGRIQQEIAWSKRARRRRRLNIETPPPTVARNPYLAEIPDDLSIPKFLRREIIPS
jgi:hypothetical protein